MKQELSHTNAYSLTTYTEQPLIDSHITECDKLGVEVDVVQHQLPTMHWIPKLHKNPYKARFIANSTSCTTTKISKLLTSCLTAVKDHVKRYCDTVYNNSGLNIFWSIKNSNDVLNKLQSKHFQVSSISTYDFSTLYTSLPHYLIKSKLLELIRSVFTRENKPFLACNYDRAFFTYATTNNYTMWTCSQVCDALNFLLDNIFVRFGKSLYRQVIGIPMGTNCAPLIADLFLYCFERDFMLRLDKVTQADIIDSFNNTSRYLDDILNIDNPYFDNLVSSIYPIELQLNKTNSSDVSAPFLDLALSINDNIISSKIYDKRDDFDFNIVNYPNLTGDVPRMTSYGVYISQLIRFARACSSVDDFIERNKFITAKLLKQGFRYEKLRKSFSKFYHRNITLISKYQTNLKYFLRVGISQPDYYGDVINKIRKIIGKPLYVTLLKKRIKKFLNKGYNPTILQHSAGLVVDSKTMNHLAGFFDCATTGQS